MPSNICIHRGIKGLDTVGFGKYHHWNHAHLCTGGQDLFPLLNLHMLQLGTVSSHSTINFRTETLVTAPGVNSTVYMDIANFNCYDMIIGTLFMQVNQVHLYFEYDQVIVNRVAIPATKVLLTHTARCLRRYCATDKKKD